MSMLVYLGRCLLGSTSSSRNNKFNAPLLRPYFHRLPTTTLQIPMMIWSIINMLRLMRSTTLPQHRLSSVRDSQQQQTHRSRGHCQDSSVSIPAQTLRTPQHAIVSVMSGHSGVDTSGGVIYEGDHQQLQQQPPPPLFGKAFKFCSLFTYSLSLLKYLLFNCYRTITMSSIQTLPSFNLTLDYQDRYIRFSISQFFFFLRVLPQPPYFFWPQKTTPPEIPQAVTNPVIVQPNHTCAIYRLDIKIWVRINVLCAFFF